MDALMFVDCTTPPGPRSSSAPPKRAAPKPSPVGSLIDKRHLDDLKIECIAMQELRRRTAKILKDKFVQIKTLTEMVGLMSVHEEACEAATKSFDKYHMNAMAYMGTAVELALKDDPLDKAHARKMMNDFWTLETPKFE